MLKAFHTILLLLSGLSLTAQLTLEPIAKPQGGGDISRIGQIGNTLFYAASSTFYRSDDGGLNWAKIPYNLNVSSSNVKVIGLDGKLYIATNTKLYRSDDLGQNWQALSTNSPGSSWRSMIALPSGVLLGATYYNLLRSTDGGMHWDTVAPTPNVYEARFVYDQYMGKVYCAMTNNNGCKILRSNDGGATWAEIFTGDASIDPPALVALPDGTLLAGGREDDKIWRSTDDGANWTGVQVADWANSPATSICFTDSGRLYCQFWFQTFYSDDKGLTWKKVSADWGDEISGYRYFHGIGLFGQLNSMYRSTDDGATWQFANTGIRAGSVLDLTVLDDNRYFAVTYDGLFSTADGGANWNALVYTEIKDLYEADMTIKAGPDETLYLATADTLLRSTDAGQHWENIETQVQYDNYKAYFAVNPVTGTLYMGGYPDMYVSFDKGTTWVERAAGGQLNLQSYQFNSQGTAYGTIAYKYIMVRSNDDFLSWDTIRVPNTGDWAPIKVGHNGFLTAHLYPKIYRSFDDGLTWDSLYVSVNSYSGPVFNTANYIFGEVNYWDLQYSVDYGMSWQPLAASNDPYLTLTDPKYAFSPSQRLYIADGYNFYRTTTSTISLALLRGRVYEDADKDCEPAVPEPVRPGFLVRASHSGAEYYGTSNQGGWYQMPIENGNWTLEALPPNPLWAACSEPVTISTANGPVIADSVDAGLQVVKSCPYMEATIGTTFLRRCFPGQYIIRYKNSGTAAATSAWLEISLDPYLEYVNASLPAAVNGQMLAIPLGNIAPGQQGEVVLRVNVRCDAELGQVHCTSVLAYPHIECADNWNGSLLTLHAACEGNSARFTIRNAGAAMAAPAEYAWQMNTGSPATFGTFQLLHGQEKVINVPVPPNAEYVYFRHNLENGYPYGSFRSATVHGCPVGNPGEYAAIWVGGDVQEPFWSQNCMPNAGAFDPNDKTGMPAGIQSDHRVELRQRLTYLIRFQNTGTDTAFQVIVRDTLSPWLDPATLRLETYSHPVRMELSGTGNLAFYFQNILLPDSNINEAASHGFLQYSIAPRENAPLHTRVENRASIYFDFNDPVLTNTTWHTLGLPFAVSAWTDIAPGGQLSAYPSPFRETLTVDMPANQRPKDCRLEIADMLGKTQFSTPVNAWPYRCTPGPLPAGAYLIRLTGPAGQVLAVGKAIHQ